MFHRSSGHVWVRVHATAWAGQACLSLQRHQSAYSLRGNQMATLLMRCVCWYTKRFRLCALLRSEADYSHHLVALRSSNFAGPTPASSTSPFSLHMELGAKFKSIYEKKTKQNKTETSLQEKLSMEKESMREESLSVSSCLLFPRTQREKSKDECWEGSCKNLLLLCALGHETSTRDIWLICANRYIPWCFSSSAPVLPSLTFSNIGGHPTNPVTLLCILYHYTDILGILRAFEYA